MGRWSLPYEFKTGGFYDILGCLFHELGLHNNVVDASTAALGLFSNEYVTEIMFVFGTVKAGFAQVEQPQIYVDVLKILPNGYQFANKVDCGGKYGGKWVIGSSTTVTKIFSNSKLPKTGY